MLEHYRINGESLDSLDLKVLLVTKGVKVSAQVYKAFGRTHRLHPDPETCNCLLLPDGTVVHLVDLAMHMGYIKKALSWDMLRNLRYAFQLQTPFSLDVADSGHPVLLWKDEEVTRVMFPPASRFYQQRTSGGLPFLGNAVLQGLDFLSFQCLWPCQYAQAGQACQFCYSGGLFERLSRKGKPLPPTPTPRDVAEIAHYAFMVEGTAKHIQLTGGSTMNTQAECAVIKEYLNEIDQLVGLKNIPGEILIYTTPPSDPAEVDQLFSAGADRVVCSLEVWDEQLARVITPGKWKFAGRQRFLNCLKYIAKRYGPNRACSSFVVGLEPVETYLEAANTLASEGIVPIASIWMPFGRPVQARMQTPGLDYYRKIKEGLARVYETHGVVPPGSNGLNVCICRDVWNHLADLSDSSRPCQCYAPSIRHLAATPP
ncbi:MAG: radical SAM protein [Thermoguttaceae bacterium]|jgi:hypothetical protein